MPCPYHIIVNFALSITPHNRFTALFLGPPRWAHARRELLDFMVQGKINRGRHTDHLAGRHSIRLTSARLHHTPQFFTGQMPFLPPNQQCQSTEGNYRIRIREKMLESSSMVLSAPPPYLLHWVNNNNLLLPYARSCDSITSFSSMFWT